ncbi:MAG: bifunctional hydroxymethylpyrimidine kinase/phosphomethylpyrimidine kinase [Alphaproteobacteria bacterium]|nr:bifunctional hydroxymethylpyrimidine kinase/phosphomethylpyrimidine kinase [Alphaproteobacteria bacterium]MCB9930167.1 bifunctional hydroxymethylpyrimidine kinase/phosphomethylpyrimidine kinase [Alphaproteobacteria bacterium]
MSRPPRVLVVAGSDSGGGAGIQADIKTLSALGAYAMTAVTAITVQNSQGVSDVHAIPPEVVAAQMRACLDDIGADAIKLGMLHSAPLIQAVAEVLADHAAIPVIADPVMVAKGGAALLQSEAVGALAEHILPRAHVMTPNTEEAAVLIGAAVADRADQERAARAMVERFGAAVLLKGGHLSGAGVLNLLLQPGGAAERFVSPRLETRHTHGTGCTLASAIAGGVAHGLSLADAVGHACRFVHAGIANAPGFGQGHGPIDHLSTRFRLESRG